MAAGVSVENGTIEPNVKLYCVCISYNPPYEFTSMLLHDMTVYVKRVEVIRFGNLIGGVEIECRTWASTLRE